jgi:hypothetical protein
MTGNVTFSVSNSYTGNSFAVLLTQDGTGNRCAFWPSTFKFAGNSNILSTLGGSVDFVNSFYDGSNYYTVVSKGFV